MQVDSTQSATQSQAPARQMDFDSPRGQQILKALSDKLGMSGDDLKSQLQSGKSLRDIANDKGVSMHDLFQSVRQALGGSDGAQGAHGHHHHHGGGGASNVDSEVMQAVAQKLGVSTDDLASELKSGKGLMDIAKEKGVSEDDLVQTLQQAFQQVAPYGQGGNAGSADYSTKVDTAA